MGIRLLAGLVVALIVAAAVASAQVRVTGDSQGWAEVMAAYERLAKLRIDRMKMTGQGQTTPALFGVVNPDRTRQVFQTGNATLEMIIVGQEIRYRLTGPGMSGTWLCQGAPPAGRPPPQPGKFEGEVTISRLGESTVEGARAQGYAYTMRTQGQTSKQRLFVLADGGLPRRVEVLDAGDQVVGTLDYYDFNAPITIELPKCG
jgi:hypothetical protein